MIWIFFTLAFSLFAQAEEKALPYLGPGSDKLSKAEYERIYKNYIQTSILLDYPFLQGTPAACDQALQSVFRQAGLYTYPVPGDAQVQKAVNTLKGQKVETYLSGGMIVQLARSSITKAPERLVWVNSGSTKASRRLGEIAKKELLTLEKDPVTGLERVKGLPVGFPHPFLNEAGQGLFVRIVKFVSNKESCRPEEFFDNAWSGGFDLSNDRCLDLQNDAEAVWAEKMKPADFRDRELKRLKDRAKRNAMDTGLKEAEAQKMVDKHFVSPYTNEINVVGSAMRNLAQCKLISLGNKEKRVVPPAGGSDKPSMDSPGDTKSAQ